MSEAQTRTLNDVLDGNVPLRANRTMIDRLRRTDHAFIALALSPSFVLGSGTIHALHEVLGRAEGEHLDFFLTGLREGGGNCWRAVSMLRDHYKTLRVIVPSKASPGASQIALGADEIEMSSAGCLTAPRDAFDHTDDTPAREVVLGHAGLITRAARDAEQTLPDGAARRLARLVTSLADRQQYQRRVTQRCLETHQSAEATQGILDTIGDASFGERLPITRRDCEHALGLNVVCPDGDRWRAMLDLHEYYRSMFGVEGDLAADNQHYQVGYDGFIDAPGERRVLLRITRTDERGHPLPDRAPLYRWITPHGGELVLDQELTL
jgi:hypothetical protein